MAFSFREMTLPMQAVIFAGLAVILIAAGMFAPLSPIQKTKAELNAAKDQVESLKVDVTRLQAIQRKVGEVRGRLDALQREIANLRNIVPEEKETDSFIRTLNAAANDANVSIRRLTAKAVVPKELYAEMPFELEIDGPYYNIQEFFTRLGSESRIINVGDLNFTGVAEGRGKKFPMRPGTSVTGTFVATTFFTKGASGAAPAKAAPGKPGAAAAPAPR
jgi:type IV pilus assembly protein PilO